MPQENTQFRYMFTYLAIHIFGLGEIYILIINNRVAKNKLLTFANILKAL